MSETDIKAENLDYATFAATLNQLSESDRASAAGRVQQLLRGAKNKKSGIQPGSQYTDEVTAFRADIAAEVLRELVRAGKIKRLVAPAE